MSHDMGSDSVTRMQAAALAFAMLRFEQASAHESRGEPPPGHGRVGVDEFLFLPSWKSTPRTEVVSFLADLPCPALLFPTTTRGLVSLMLLDELSGERRFWGEKTLNNHLAAINEVASELGLKGDSKVIAEFADEVHVLSIDVLRVWSQRFGAPVGWNIGAARPDEARASAQLHLYASDGRVTPGWAAKAPWQRPEEGMST